MWERRPAFSDLSIYPRSQAMCQEGKLVFLKLFVFRRKLVHLKDRVSFRRRIIDHLSPDFGAPSLFFGCCTTDSQSDKDQNLNNLKIGAPKSGDRTY